MRSELNECKIALVEEMRSKISECKIALAEEKRSEPLTLKLREVESNHKKQIENLTHKLHLLHYENKAVKLYY